MWAVFVNEVYVIGIHKSGLIKMHYYLQVLYTTTPRNQELLTASYLYRGTVCYS